MAIAPAEEPQGLSYRPQVLSAAEESEHSIAPTKELRLPITLPTLG